MVDFSQIELYEFLFAVIILLTTIIVLSYDLYTHFTTNQVPPEAKNTEHFSGTLPKIFAPTTKQLCLQNIYKTTLPPFPYFLETLKLQNVKEIIRFPRLPDKLKKIHLIDTKIKAELPNTCTSLELIRSPFPTFELNNLKYIRIVDPPPLISRISLYSPETIFFKNVKSDSIIDFPTHVMESFTILNSQFRVCGPFRTINFSYTTHPMNVQDDVRVCAEICKIHDFTVTSKSKIHLIGQSMDIRNVENISLEGDERIHVQNLRKGTVFIPNSYNLISVKLHDVENVTFDYYGLDKSLEVLELDNIQDISYSKIPCPPSTIVELRLCNILFDGWRFDRYNSPVCTTQFTNLRNMVLDSLPNLTFIPYIKYADTVVLRNLPKFKELSKWGKINNLTIIKLPIEHIPTIKNMRKLVLEDLKKLKRLPAGNIQEVHLSNLPDTLDLLPPLQPIWPTLKKTVVRNTADNRYSTWDADAYSGVEVVVLPWEDVKLRK